MSTPFGSFASSATAKSGAGAEQPGSQPVPIPENAAIPDWEKPVTGASFTN